MIFEIAMSVLCSREWTVAQSYTQPVLVPIKTSVTELGLQIGLL